MNKIITIHLNFNAYQVEEDGYTALHAYLEKAAAKLHDNPDKDEVMADFEQAIADKCAKYLTKTKQVVTTAEIKEVLEAMGPVEDTGDSTKAAKTTPTGPKRLFKIREGAVIEGVCNGIAAYFDVDATIVRVVFIILTVLTGGAWIAAYILMAIFMPEARTAEDIAAAQGKPFNAQTLIDEAKERYEYWKQFGKEKSEEWREAHREAADAKKSWKSWKYEQAAWKRTPTPEEIAHWHGGGGKRFLRFLAGVVGGIGVLCLLALTVLWVWQIIVLATGGSVFGYFGQLPLVTSLILVCALFFVIFLPLQAFVGSALRYAKGVASQPRFWGMVFTFLLWVGAGAAVVVIARTNPAAFAELARLYDGIKHTLGI